jgi:LPXTG-motif cell wall-anchored protein
MEIMAMLRGIEISGKKPGSDKQLALKAKEDETGTEDRRSPIVLLFAGVAILVFLVLMYRRRKKKRPNKN